MRVVHLSTVHPRRDTRVFRKECRSIAKAGIETYLVVGDGLGEELLEGVCIIGTKKSPNRLHRMTIGAARVFKRGVSLQGQIYHIHDPELLTVGLALKFAGKKVVFDSHENVPSQIALKAYIPKLIRPLVAGFYRRLERVILRRLDGVVTATAQQALEYCQLGVAVVSVENFADVDSFSQVERNYDKIKMFHAGAITVARGGENMIRLSKALGDRGELVLAGVIRDGITISPDQNLRYLGVVDMQDLMGEYEKCNAGLILYNDVGQYGGATAVKLYEYMAAGVPVIVPSHGDWPRMIADVGCGVAVDVTDVDDQLRAIDWLRSHPSEAREMGLRGRRYVVRESNWNNAFEKLKALYLDIGGVT